MFKRIAPPILDKKKKRRRRSHRAYQTKKRNRKRKKRQKQTRKATVIPNSTPKKNIILKNRVKKCVGSSSSTISHSFSPSINKKIRQQQTIYRKNNKIFECQKDYIKVIQTNKPKCSKCIHFKKTKAQKTMLQNLLSKDKISCKKITAPKQLLANCWFNVFFFAFFISDRGRKFFRYLREIMITGKNRHGKKIIDDYIASTFFHFNLLIEAAIQGNDLARLMDTNIIIRELSTLVKWNFPKVDTSWSPLEFYDSIINYLHDDPHHILYVYPTKIEQFPHKNNSVIQKYKSKYKKLPNIIIILIDDKTSCKIKNTPVVFTLSSSQDGGTKYVLDSIIIRDTKQQHFVCCITCNDKGYVFDGESFSRINPFKWTLSINKDKKWKFKSPFSTHFNFMKGAQYLIYYRV